MGSGSGSSFLLERFLPFRGIVHDCHDDDSLIVILWAASLFDISSDLGGPTACFHCD